MTLNFTPEQIEQGRVFFAGPCTFVAAAGSPASLPPLGLPEIAFAGRSNVGKSSLVNALTGRKTLARTSQTPGRTRQLIFFQLGERLQMVDLPGYGYAKASKTVIKAWTELTRQFLAGRQSLSRLFLLIDARRGIGTSDQEMMQMMDESALSWAVVLTKMDHLKEQDKAPLMADITKQLGQHVAAFPHLFISSAHTGEGVAELRAHIHSLALKKHA